MEAVPPGMAAGTDRDYRPVVVPADIRVGASGPAAVSGPGEDAGAGAPRKCEHTHGLQLKHSEGREAVVLGHEDEVLDIEFGPDGCNLVAAGEDATVVVWDIMSQSRIVEVKVGVTLTAVAYAPDGQYIVAVDANSRLHAWSLDGEGGCKEVGTATVEGKPLAVALVSRPRALVAVGTTAKKVSVRSLPSMELFASLEHHGHVNSLCFSQGERRAVLAGGGGTDDMHGLMTRKGGNRGMKTVLWSVSPIKKGFKYIGEVDSDNIVHAAAFSPCKTMLAMGGESNSITVVGADVGLKEKVKMLCAAGVRCLAWSPDSLFLASGGEDMRISVWDATSGCLVLQLPKADDWYHAVAFSGDGLWLASCVFGRSEVTLQPIEYILDLDECDTGTQALLEQERNGVAKFGQDCNDDAPLHTRKFSFWKAFRGCFCGL